MLHRDDALSRPLEITRTQRFWINPPPIFIVEQNPQNLILFHAMPSCPMHCHAIHCMFYTTRPPLEFLQKRTHFDTAGIFPTFTIRGLYPCGLLVSYGYDRTTIRQYTYLL